MRTHLYVSPSLKKFRDEVLTLPPTRQRFDYFTGKIDKHLEETFYDETDTHIFYRRSTYRPLFNKTLFLKPSKGTGFTLDKKGKLKLWNGFNMITDLTTDFLKQRGVEWLDTEGFHSMWLTKGLLERVLKGKVTNPSEACRYLIGAYRWPKTTSPELLRKFIKNKYAKSTLLAKAFVAKDINAVLEMGNNFKQGSILVEDLVKQAQILNRKIDFTWSDKRMESEHNQWTKEIMALELELFEDFILPYGKLICPPGVELLKSKKEVFAEGTLMKHCIYTNYWRRIKSGNYLAFHVDSGEGGFTVGLHEDYSRSNVFINGIPQPTYQFDQAFGIGNRYLTDSEKTLRESLFSPQLLLAASSMMEGAYKAKLIYEKEPEERALPF